MRVKLLNDLKLGVLAISLSLTGCDGGYLGDRAFDSAQWKAADTLDETRCEMVDDLLKKVSLEGRSRENVVELLGEPDKQENGPDFYVLCPKMIDFMILEVKWDETDRVASTKVRST